MNFFKRKFGTKADLLDTLRDPFFVLPFGFVLGTGLSVFFALHVFQDALMHYCRPTPVQSEFVCRVPDGGFPPAPKASPAPNKQTNKQTFLPALNKQKEISL